MALEQLAGHMQSMLPEINRLCAEMGRPVVYAATGDATLTALAVQARLSPVSSEGSEADGFHWVSNGFQIDFPGRLPSGSESESKLIESHERLDSTQEFHGISTEVQLWHALAATSLPNLSTDRSRGRPIQPKFN